MTPELTEQIKAARRVSTPIIAIQTADPFATEKSVCAAINTDCPKITWDISRGLRAINQGGLDALNELLTDTPPESITEPVVMLKLANELPNESVLFVHNAHKYLGYPDLEVGACFVQAVCNLRDAYKQSQRTLILLAPAFQLPAELSQDVMVIDEELPGDEELRAITNTTYQAAGFPLPSLADSASLLPAMRGLAAFPAEQSLAMSLRKGGAVDMETLWFRKKSQVEQTRGLHFTHETDQAKGLSGVGGNDVIKSLIDKLFTGPMPPRVICFVDEVSF